jgi:NADPH2:quinone reductase
VDEAWLGRRVVSGTGGSGGYAERVAVAASGLIEIPAGVATDDAVALLADGRTAVALVRAAALQAGERALVEAAGGGVGTVLTQLCALAGARVIGAARGQDKLRLARDLGAEQAVDYTEPGWAKNVQTGVGGVQVVFDGVGGPIAAEAFELLGPGGRMLSYGMASGSFAQVPDDVATARGVTLIRGVPASPAEAAGLTRAALTEAAAGRLRPVIGQRFPLAHAAAAHAAIESRSTIGKTLLVVTR